MKTGLGRHLSNVYDPKLPNARRYLTLGFEDQMDPGGPQRAWEQHLAWIAEHVIGPPKATEAYTMRQLEDMGMVGVYAHKYESAGTASRTPEQEARGDDPLCKCGRDLEWHMDEDWVARYGKAAVETRRGVKAVTTLVLVALLCVSAGAQTGFGEKKAKTLDWSFVKDWRFSLGVGLSGAGLLADQQSSRAAERRGAIETNPNVRDANGHLDRSKQSLFWVVGNAALLPADLNPNHKWRWVSFGGRVFLGVWSFSRAVHNFGVKGGR